MDQLLANEQPWAITHGFSVAVIFPAVISVVKQAQRQASTELHLLATYYEACAAGHRNQILSPEEERILDRVSEILIEQIANGGAFYALTNIGLATCGVAGGVAAQAFITGNSMLNPEQTQYFNPGERLFKIFGHPKWLGLTGQHQKVQIAMCLGRAASFLSYGNCWADGADKAEADVAFLLRGVN